MTTFNRTMAESLAASARCAVAQVLSDHDVQVALKGTRYGADRVTVTLELTRTGVDLNKKHFEQAAHLFGLQPDDYGKRIKLDGREFVVIGLSLSRPKFPILARCARSGKEFKLTEGAVRRALSVDADKL
jgi:hypothetical protein